VLSCVYVAALWRAHPQSKESQQMCIGLRKWKRGQGPTKGCRAIDGWMNERIRFNELSLHGSWTHRITKITLMSRSSLTDDI
jgi:hypothetical protein